MSNLRYSIIIPLYNRPNEIKELLESLLIQKKQNFEIVIVEDGSKIKSEEIIKKYSVELDIKYYFKQNEGPGLTRNYGAQRATGDYFIFFDSDCIIPEKYFETVDEFLNKNYVDAYGGPDAAHSSFTPIQKAISYSMTSFFTTGGIRGGKEKMEKFHPRSFNMGYSSEVFEQTKGFSKMRFGEDIDMSLRIMENGFQTALIKEAFVYHKRRTDFRKFFKQVHNSGIARINLFKRHPKSLKIVHFLPAVFTIGVLFIVILSFISMYFIVPLLLYIFMIFVDALIKNKSVKVGFLSIPASFVQLIGYGTGFIKSFWIRLILKKPEFHSFKKNFYK